MKKILILTGIVSTLITGTLIAQNTQQKQRTTRAQAQQNSAARAQQMTDRMAGALQLSADQKQKVYQIMLESQKQPMRTKEQTAKFNAQLDAVLTSEQKATMQRLKEQKVQPDRMSQLRQNDLKAAPALQIEQAGMAK